MLYSEKQPPQAGLFYEGGKHTMCHRFSQILCTQCTAELMPNWTFWHDVPPINRLTAARIDLCAFAAESHKRYLKKRLTRVLNPNFCQVAMMWHTQERLWIPCTLPTYSGLSTCKKHMLKLQNGPFVSGVSPRFYPMLFNSPNLKPHHSPMTDDGKIHHG